MTEDKLIQALIKMAQGFEANARYIEQHNFTPNRDQQTPMVIEESSISYQKAADELYSLVADYILSKRCNHSTNSLRVNYLIKLRANRVFSL